MSEPIFYIVADAAYSWANNPLRVRAVVKETDATLVLMDLKAITDSGVPMWDGVPSRYLKRGPVPRFNTFEEARTVCAAAIEAFRAHTKAVDAAEAALKTATDARKAATNKIVWAKEKADEA